MRIYIIILLCLLSNTSFCQKLKDIVEEDYNLFCRNEYTVLKKDKSVKHGGYKSIYVSGNPRQEGYYKFGKKDSLWVYFNPFKPLISSRGYYENDKKVGIWQYFDDKEQPRHLYNHSTGVLNFTTYTDTNKTHSIKVNDSIVETKVMRPPFFLLGEKYKMRIVRDNIVYPSQAIENNIYGTVIVSFFIDKYGKAKDHRVSQSIGGGCDEEALRVVQMLPDEWVPGIYKNALAEVQVSILITFQLN